MKGFLSLIWALSPVSMIGGLLKYKSLVFCFLGYVLRLFCFATFLKRVPLFFFGLRARELFYYLKGGQVDYGEEHSTACGHSQFGRIYEQGLEILMFCLLFLAFVYL